MATPAVEKNHVFRRKEMFKQSLEQELKTRAYYLADILCPVFKTTIEEFDSSSREAKLIIMRSMVCRVLKKAGYGYTDIGKVFGRSHATIIYYVSKTKIPHRYQPIYAKLEAKDQTWAKQYL